MGSKIERCILHIARKVSGRRVGGGKRKFKKGIHVLGGGDILERERVIEKESTIKGESKTEFYKRG